MEKDEVGEGTERVGAELQFNCSGQRRRHVGSGGGWGMSPGLAGSTRCAVPPTPASLLLPTPAQATSGASCCLRAAKVDRGYKGVKSGKARKVEDRRTLSFSPLAPVRD